MHSKSNILILGGNSRIAVRIEEIALNSGYQVLRTKRSLGQGEKFDQKLICLDVSSQKSIKEFFLRLQDLKFERIISLIGKTSIHIDKSNQEDLRNYYLTYTLNLFQIIEKLSKNFLEAHSTSQLTAIASRSAHHGSFDANYAAVKGALVSYIRSLGTRLVPPKGAISISPGLIVGSEMFDQMSVLVQQDHWKRSEGKLLNVKEAAEFIWSMSLLPYTNSEPGGNYLLGPDYK